MNNAILKKYSILASILFIVCVAFFFAYTTLYGTRNQENNHVLEVQKVKDPLITDEVKKQLITDAREIAIKYKLINISIWCVLSEIEKPEDISATQVIVTFREKHDPEGTDNCKGDPSTSPRLFSIAIDRTTGNVFTDANPEIQMEELKVNVIEKEAMNMTLPVLKDTLITYFKKFNDPKEVPDKDFEDFNSYYWVYMRRAPEDANLSFLKGLVPDNFEYAWNRLGPCFGIPEGQCRE